MSGGRWAVAAGVSVLFLIGGGVAYWAFAAPASSNSQPSPRAPIDAGPTVETGPQTPCHSDADCACRVFNGARFSPGSVPSHCCKTATGGQCPALDHCAGCTYE